MYSLAVLGTLMHRFREALFVRRLEFKRLAIHAIAQTGGLRSIGKDMAKMSLAFRAADLGAMHEMRIIRMFLDGASLHGRIETRPAGSGIKLGLRLE